LHCRRASGLLKLQVMKRPNVIIVGGGPVGVALALDLGLRNVSSVIVESRATLGNIPKGQGLTQRTLEHFYFWGLDKELRAVRTLPPGYPIGEITAYGSLTSKYWHAPAGREVVGEFFFQKQERLPQYRMESVLRRKLATLNIVTLRVGVTATAVAQSTEGVCVTITNEIGESEKLEADYLVGCDGGHSMVREAAGIARSGTDFDQTMALVVFSSQDLHEKLKRFPERSTYRVMHPDLCGYWKFFGRVDADQHFFFHAPVKANLRGKDVDFKAVLFDAAGFEFTFEVEHAGFWELRNAVAATYQNGRIFIAGDAAHSHPPYGGYGLNNGLEDAANLSWKLAAYLAGWGGERLLNTYSSEREPIFRDIAEDFIAKRIREDGVFLSRYNPARDRVEFEAAWKARDSDVGSRRKAYEPNYEASPIVFGPPGGKTTAHGVHSLRARAGHHLSPQVLANGRNVYEELGRNFTLLALGADGGDFERAARARGVPLKIVDDIACSTQDTYGAPLVIVRPDQHVAWTGTMASDADAVIQKVTGQ
jgi:2-polyprenyl-6-methoxyphenol hydroxylase-like FAD-dependent oxidoreductase